MGINNLKESIQAKINNIDMLLEQYNVEIDESILNVNDDKPPMTLSFEEIVALREAEKQDLLAEKQVYLDGLRGIESNTSFDV